MLAKECELSEQQMIEKIPDYCKRELQMAIEAHKTCTRTGTSSKHTCCRNTKAMILISEHTSD